MSKPSERKTARRLKGFLREQARKGNRNLATDQMLADARAPHLPVFRRLQGQVSRLVVVTTVVDPPLKPQLIDRFMVACVRDGLDLLLVINKCDLWGEAEKEQAAACRKLYENLGVGVNCVSAHTGEGVAALREALKAAPSALAGQSGVGKSSLVNALAGRQAQRTGELSKATGKGRHTTTQPVKLDLGDGLVVWDLPGIKFLKLWDVPRKELRLYFPELVNLPCRYADCLHQGEEGCALPAAVEEGRAQPRRVASYHAMLQEAHTMGR